MENGTWGYTHKEYDFTLNIDGTLTIRKGHVKIIIPPCESGAIFAMNSAREATVARGC